VPSRLLVPAFGISDQVRVVSLVGAGGKSSLMYALAHELVARGKTVVSTTTTKIFRPRPDESPHLVLARNTAELADLSARLSEFKHVTIGTSIDATTGKLQGVAEEIITTAAKVADLVVVEADGAAGRPVKAPAPWEPVIPSCTDLVIMVVGLDCLGRPANEEFAFRLKEFLALTGLAPGDPVMPASIGRLVVDKNGGLKGVTPQMNFIPFLNKLDLLTDRELFVATVNAIRERGRERIQKIVVGTLKENVQVEAFE